MQLRKKVYPRSLRDVFPMTFVILIIPVIYWFELFVVLPALFSLTSPFYIFNVIFGHFLLFNIVGNLLGIIFVDTSINKRFMPSIKNIKSEDCKDLGYCDVCETVIPPRSYHCPVCDVCILKRDHHCAFSGCCIGHHNYRFYILFLFHMTITTAYSIPYNLIFLWPAFTLSNFFNTLKFLCPMLIFIFGIELGAMQCYLLIFFIILLGLAFVGFCLYYHTKLLLNGRVVHEERMLLTKYDLGTIDNIKEALGIKWHLVWLSPFLESRLPHDGITFAVKPHSK